MRLPDFLFIGPSKAGSTWLFETLRRHPGIYVPPAKDIYFFDRYYNRGLDWYARQFAGADNGDRVIGEFSHDYLYSKDAAGRISRDLPDVKLIATPRNPFERAISHYRFSLRNGAKFRDFADGAAQNPAILTHSLYADALETYLDKFPDDQVFIAPFDRLKAEPQRFLDDLCGFLGVDPGQTDPDKARRNSAAAARNPWLARQVHRAANALRDRGMGAIVGALKRSPVRNALYSEAKQDELRLSEADFAHMQALFLPDIAATEGLTGLNLDAWKRTRLEDLAPRKD
ncbi:MAG: sulfotransferase [Euryhalocaulis sp.]|uniref:sulfotransferase family protein n=1 Tax=Euryhalocaulis sp. TaxID=2744307 RepID=UPI0017F58F08|nr:sulfotransferase domain-containing protein [Euryhalocaulis sp.]MBA4802335.1 sulfotransferase [Euryhalocaulis sp.]